MMSVSTIFTVLRMAGTIALLYLVWLHAHWSVVAVLALQAFAIEGIGAALKIHAKHIRAQEKGIAAAMQSFDRQAGDFTDFVATINAQAEAVKREMNRCRECEMHGAHGVRPGSIHNKRAPNCLMNPNKTTI